MPVNFIGLYILPFVRILQKGMGGLLWASTMEVVPSNQQYSGYASQYLFLVANVYLALGGFVGDLDTSVIILLLGRRLLWRIYQGTKRLRL
jgi:hypothetical protein